MFNSILNLSELISWHQQLKFTMVQILIMEQLKDVAIKILRPDIKKFNEEIDALMLFCIFN